MRILITILTSISLTLIAYGGVQANESLTVVSWGGPYAASQQQAYITPFAAETGITIDLREYQGGLHDIEDQVRNAKVTWDVVDMVFADNISACEKGLLETIDHRILYPAPDGTAARNDFIDGGLTPCGVSHNIASVVLAYHRGAFPGEKPSTIRDLFDIEKFPGKRALQKNPVANLEWALLSYNVPREDLYDLLSTERGLNLAFSRLDSIREHIVWWTDVGEPVALLNSGVAAMASGFNGRFFNAMMEDKQPINIIWDGQLYSYSTWGIPKGSERRNQAMQFIRFATETWRMAELSAYIAYGPTRKSAAKLVDTHYESGVDMRPHMPNNAVNFQRAIEKEYEWYAKTGDRLTQRFDAWLQSQ
ncbi:MAG: extracellular solute-binding protein [Gammaproteobacteria bacterium]|nr:extracellular solute-binding protein [Gammaproteobacteria bacterium]